MAIQRLPCGPLHQNTTVQLAVRKRSLHRWISSTCYLESLMCSELSCCNCINTIRPIIMSNRGGTISTIVYHSHCLSHLSSTQSKYCLWSKQPVLRSVRYCGTKCALRSVRSPISRASRRDDLRRLGSYGLLPNFPVPQPSNRLILVQRELWPGWASGQSSLLSEMQSL